VNPFKDKDTNFYIFAEKLLGRNGKMTKQKMLSAISPFVVIDEQNYRDKIENNFASLLEPEEYTLEEFVKFIEILAHCFEINTKSNLDLNNDRSEESKAHLQKELFNLNRKFKNNANKYERLEKELTGKLQAKAIEKIQVENNLEQVQQFWIKRSAERERVIVALREDIQSEKKLNIEKQNELTNTKDSLIVQKERDVELLKESVQSEKKLRIEKENELNEEKNELWKKFCDQCDVTAQRERDIELLKFRAESEEKLKNKKENELHELKTLWNQEKYPFENGNLLEDNSEKWESFASNDEEF